MGIILNKTLCLQFIRSFKLSEREIEVLCNLYRQTKTVNQNKLRSSLNFTSATMRKLRRLEKDSRYFAGKGYGEFDMIEDFEEFLRNSMDNELNYDVWCLQHNHIEGIGILTSIHFPLLRLEEGLKQMFNKYCTPESKYSLHADILNFRFMDIDSQDKKNLESLIAEEEQLLENSINESLKHLSRYGISYDELLALAAQRIYRDESFEEV